MIELIHWAVQNWGRNITAGSIAALVLILFDKFVKDLILTQLKRMFHLDENEQFATYVRNQARIELKVDMLLHERGLIWSGVDETSASTQMSLSWYYRLLWAIRMYAKNVVQLWRLNMKNINRAILVPLLSAIALFIKEVSGYEVDDQYIDMAANIIMYLIMFAGLFIHPRKRTDPVDPFLQDTAE